MRIPYVYTVFIVLGAGIILGALFSVEASNALIEFLLYILILSAGLSMGRLWAENGFPSGKTAFHGIVLGVGVMVVGGLVGFIIGEMVGVDPMLTGFAGLASGWYSIAGPIVSLYDPVIGLAAFTANLLREVLHIAIYPVLAQKGYRCESVSLGGATTMDTGLPVVIKYGGLDASLLALSQGAVITGLVPIIATLLFS